MMDSYEDATKAMVEALVVRSMKREQDVRMFMESTHSTVHVGLLCDIILGHAGGRKFMVTYGVPFEPSNTTHKAILTDINRFFMSTYKVVVLPTGGVVIANFDISTAKYLRGDRYEGHTYQRFQMKGDTIEIDFKAKKENISTLLFLAPFINVAVYDLCVPKNIMCRPEGTHLSTKPMEENDTPLLMSEIITK